jgi:hypothetical protein
MGSALPQALAPKNPKTTSTTSHKDQALFIANPLLFFLPLPKFPLKLSILYF